MQRYKDEKGKVYGRLTVIERGVSPKGQTDIYWSCQCSCGNECVVRGNALRSGATQSCGCLRIELLRKTPRNMKAPGVAAFNILYNQYLKDAARKNREFALTKEQLKEIVDKDCFYCGSPPANVCGNRTDGRINGTYTYNGIDRVDSSKGYIIENCVPCCWQCNQAKRDLPKSEFLAWVDKIYKHQNPTKG